MHPTSIDSSRQPVLLQRADAVPITDEAFDMHFFNFGDFLRRLGAHKWAIALVTVAGASAALWLASIQPPTYHAEASLEMLVPNEDFLDLRDVRSTSTPPLFSISAEDAQMKTQVEILGQDWLISRALRRVNLANHPSAAKPSSTERVNGTAAAYTPTSVEADAVRDVKKRLKIEPSHRSRIVRILYNADDPKVAAATVNALAETFIEQNTEARTSPIRETRELLDRQLRDLGGKLQRSEDELRTFSSNAGLMLNTGADTMSESKLKLLQEELQKAQAERITKESLYNTLATGLPDSMTANEVVQNYRVTLAALQRELADLESTLTPQNSRVVRKKAEIAQLESAITEELARAKDKFRKEYDAALERESVLARSVDSQSGHAMDYSGKMLRYNMLKHDLDTNLMFYDSIAQKANEAAIASTVRPADMRLLSPAQVPLRPEDPGMPLYGGVGMMAGLLVGVTYAVTKERGVRRVRTPGEAEMFLGVPQLGAIPSARLPGMRGLLGTGEKVKVIERVSLDQRASGVSESFRGALVSILSSARSGQSQRSILVTSALPMEGKTTIASNLAITLSQAQKRIVLIDGDLRRPRLHSIFSLENSKGLATFLFDKTPVKDAKLDHLVRPTSIPSLSVMTSGPTQNDASHILYSQRWRELIERLSQEFDHVIVDAPPCLKFADARILAQGVDGVLIVVRANSTYDQSAMAATRCFVSDGVPVIGTILNSWNPKSSPAYGFDRYSDHYRQAKAS